MEAKDIRWKQRFTNFINAFNHLDAAVELSKKRKLSELEQQGVIQAFEFTHELAWNVLKDYLEYQGIFNLTGSRDTSQEAFQKNLITQGQDWMDMIRSRNLSSHTYNQKVSQEIILNITSRYYPCFLDFKRTMSELMKL